MAFFDFFKKQKRSVWQLCYTVERRYEITNAIHGKEKDPEVITFFLKQDQFGNRRVEHISYGTCEKDGTHKRHDAEMKIWIETGILPPGAKNVVMQKLQGTP